MGPSEKLRHTSFVVGKLVCIHTSHPSLVESLFWALTLVPWCTWDVGQSCCLRQEPPSHRGTEGHWTVRNHLLVTSGVGGMEPVIGRRHISVQEPNVNILRIFASCLCNTVIITNYILQTYNEINHTEDR